MYALGSVLIVVLIGAVVVLLVTAMQLVFGRVDRRRLDRFALRQALVITPENGNTVIRYLATTRRWRGGMLYLAVAGLIAWVALTAEQLNVNLAVVFSGWFVGAVIAEWRVDSLARGPHAAAMLHQRRIDDYVRRTPLLLAVLVWVAVLVLGVTAVSATARRAVDLVPAAVALTASLLAAAVIVLVTRRILARPQPLVAADLLEADNAIRGRSLNVLVGCALAIGGYLGAAFVGEIVARPDSPTVHLAQLFGVLVLPILGVTVGRAPRMTPVGVPVRPLAA